MLCTHNTTTSASLDYCHKLTNPYLHQFSSISGENCINDPPKGYKTPLDKNEHPEIDTSEILELDMAAKYLTMVGQLQWLVTLGRFDLHAQVASMSRFRAAPTEEHMDSDSKGSTPMPSGPRIMQLGLELIILITLSYQTKILTGHTLYMVMSKESFLMTCQNHLARL